MQHHTKAKRALSTIQALCRQRWPTELLVPQLLAALHELIPSARNLFDWTDAEGRLLHYYIEGDIDTAVARHYFLHFHNRDEADCMPAFATLRHTPAGVRSARELAHRGFFASALYNDIWRPQGLHTRMEGVLRGDAGRLLGSLVLYRGPHDAAFTAFDEGVLAALLPTIARALERCAGQPAAAAASGPQVPARQPLQTLLLDTAGTVVHATAGASTLLLLAAGGPSPQSLTLGTQGLVDLLLGRLVQAACEHARAVAGHLASSAQPADPWPSLSLVSAFGRFDAHSALLQPLGQPHGQPQRTGSAPWLQISLRQMEPRPLAVQRVLQELPLTSGQVAVAAALYEGQPQADIARRLGVATSTVVDHARKLYCTLDVAGSAGLRKVLDDRIASAAV